ncbi:hypothetical protein Q9Q99_00300 [Curtobacterium flaccumfaciens]|nr:hypothetical protein Q9Q99_00300 [Curtobacterium flaccumfaciens]
MPGPVPAPKANTASTVDLVVTIALFVVIAMLSGFAVLFGWVLGTVSQYGCDWESSTRVCNRSMGMQTAVVEAIVPRRRVHYRRSARGEGPSEAAARVARRARDGCGGGDRPRADACGGRGGVGFLTPA